MLQKIFKYTWITRNVGENEYRFNFYNPLAWCVLFLTAIGTGIVTGIKTVVDTVVTVIAESQQPPATAQKTPKTAPKK
jgi:hypothetical protein